MARASPPEVLFHRAAAMRATFIVAAPDATTPTLAEVMERDRQALARAQSAQRSRRARRQRAPPPSGEVVGIDQSGCFRITDRTAAARATVLEGGAPIAGHPDVQPLVRGELTPGMTVKRAVVAARHGDLAEAMYR